MQRLEHFHVEDVRLVNSIVIAIIFFGLGMISMLTIDARTISDMQAEIQAIKAAKCKAPASVSMPVALK